MKKAIEGKSTGMQEFASFLALVKVMQDFQEIDPTFPLAAIIALLHIAMREEFPQAGDAHSISDLAGICKIDRQSMARLVRYLGEGDDRIGGHLRKDKDGGIGFVETFADKTDGRIKRVKLTRQGKNFMQMNVLLPGLPRTQPLPSLQIKRHK